MTTAIANEVKAEREQRILLRNISWDMYEQFLTELAEQHVRLTYDNGELELMSPSSKHEILKTRLRSIIETAALEFDVDFEPYGSVTCRRKDLAKGLESDECYYIRNADKVRDKSLDDEFDLTTQPPPDLAIEIDISKTLLSREAIYAALGVPELWRCDGDSVRVFLLKKGVYQESSSSLSFPRLPIDELGKQLKRPTGMSHVQWLKSFQKWVKGLNK
jgi:Uma2 family endonuclease